MDGDRPAGVGLLALLYAVSGALCAGGAMSPMSSRTPVALLWALAAVGFGGAALLAALRHRLSTTGVHAAVFLVSALIALLAWRSATAVGIVGLSPAMVAIGFFAAHFLSAPAARVHVGLLLAMTTAGAAAAAPGGFANAWIAVVVSTAAMAEAQARIAGRLHTAAATDPLTGLANRRAWEAEAARSLAHAARTGEPLTVAVLDLDGFKEINDEDGHSAGDLLLQSLARQWSGELRGADLLGRYGGDEFVLCLPGTDARSAGELLTRLHASHPAAWSAGTATARPEDSLHDVLVRADEDLYRHKRSRIR
ncbi:GGDEF domain-containing protein [Blastococcus sp. SYSU D00820]